MNRERGRDDFALADARLRQMMEQSPLAIAVYAPDGLMHSANSELWRILGISGSVVDCILGKHNVLQQGQFSTPPLRGLVDEAFAGRAVTLQPFLYRPQQTLTEMGLDGTPSRERWISARFYPIVDRAGLVQDVVLLAEDVTERVQAEQAHRASENRYKTLVESSTDGILIVQDGRIRFANSASSSVLGCLPQELLDSPFLRFVSPAFRDVVERRHEERLGGGSPPPVYEIEVLRGDESLLPVEINAVAIDYEGSRATLVFIRDISSRKQAEAELDSERTFSTSLIDSTPAFFVAIDKDGKTLMMNASMLSALGYTADEALETDYVATFVPEADREELGQVFSRIMEDRASTVNQNRLLCKNGETLLVEWHGAPVLSEAGVMKYFFGVGIDITDRERTQEALRQKQQETQAVVATSRDWIWAIDQDGVHTYSNPAVEAILGYSPAELIGQSNFELLHPEDRAEVDAQLPRWISEQKGWRDLVLRWRHRDGSWRWLESNAVAITDTSGSLVGFRGVDRDITERLESEQRIRGALEGAIQAIAGTIETRDPYTAGHQERVTDLAVAIAQRLDLPDEQIEGIRVAAALHDIGKISTPAEILSKPGKLTELEYKIIQEHPKIAFTILKGIAFPWPVADIVVQHHERIDGSGYPEGLKGDDILLEARILAVADTVEAMAAHRPYRAAQGIEAALDVIRKERGTTYDEDAADACLELFERNGYELPE